MHPELPAHRYDHFLSLLLLLFLIIFKETLQMPLAHTVFFHSVHLYISINLIVLQLFISIPIFSTYFHMSNCIIIIH
jgi:hypothetical protein